MSDSQLLSSVSAQCRIRSQCQLSVRFGVTELSVSSVSDSQSVSQSVSVSSVSDSQLLSSVTRIQSQLAVSAQSVLAESHLRLPLNPSMLAASAARMLLCSLKISEVLTWSLLAMAVACISVAALRCWLNETDGSTQILSNQCRN